ncbi:MAG: type II secretion system F family protein [Lachnospiraceae bacterium]|nr:type II secretion system F family protein [Lachnospiraceae bacterium]
MKWIKKKSRLRRSFLVVLLMALLSLAYVWAHRGDVVHNGVIGRKSGGTKSFHVTWKKEDFDINFRYKAKGDVGKRRDRDAKEKSAKERLNAYLIQLEKETRNQEKVILPKSFEGERIIWKKKPDYTPLFLAFLGFVLGFLLYKEEDWKEEAWEKKRKERLNRQYPQLVGSLTTLLESGMSIKNAFVQMAEEGVGKKGPLGEELNVMIHRMESGESLGKALQHFSQSCDLRPYTKLVNLVIQNQEQGSSGLKNLLENEARETESMRLNLVKQQGEKAETKILLPLTMLLSLVIVILVVPAFMQMKGM